MEDLVILSPFEFYKHKSFCEISPDIKQKYKDFFEKYICFSEQYSNVKVVYPKKYIKKECKTVKRTILGILNVINTENYKKMLMKTKMMIGEENLKEIIKEILDKCSMQIFYLHVYFNLIKDLVNSFSENEKQIAIKIIQEFMDDYLKKGYILNLYLDIEDQYQRFCLLQKNKMFILSKNTMLIEFLKHTDYLNHINIKDYAQLIYDEFFVYINQNNDIADVLLQIMLELTKHNITFDKEKLQTIKTNPKLKFHIDDILVKSK